VFNIFIYSYVLTKMYNFCMGPFFCRLSSACKFTRLTRLVLVFLCTLLVVQNVIILILVKSKVIILLLHPILTYTFNHKVWNKSRVGMMMRVTVSFSHLKQNIHICILYI